MNDFRLAKACFALSAAILAAKAFMWGVTTDWPIEMRSIVIVIAFAIIGLVAVEAFRWVNRKQTLAISAPSPPLAPATPPTPPTARTTGTPQATVRAHERPNPPEPDQRELRLRFVHTQTPSLLIENPTDSVIRDIKWAVILWNLDMPDRMDPLPIPVETFDWLRPHTRGGPLSLFGAPSVASLVKPGNRLFGSASVICPDCTRGRTYIVFIMVGQGGWYFELESEVSGNPALPSNMKLEMRELYFRELEALAPADKRVAITDEF
jgi:hypothetical protein